MKGEEMGSVDVQSVFVAAGCNRVVGCVDWGGPCNLVAFGSHNSVAIFSPENAKVLVTLPGHKDYVNCVLWLPRCSQDDADTCPLREQFLLSGGADGSIILWGYTDSEDKWRKALGPYKAHEKGVTCIAAVMSSSSSVLLSSTSSDGSARIWHVCLRSEPSSECNISLLQFIPVGSRAMVATSLTALPDSQDTFLLALGGLDNQVHFYAGESKGQFTFVCQVKGHQDWVRSLDFYAPIQGATRGMIFLASSSQDKTIKIWKIYRHKSSGNIPSSTEESPLRLNLSLKTFIDGPVFKAGDAIWQVSLESLLLGHEDWVYSVRWQPGIAGVSMEQSTAVNGNPQDSGMCVLSASMDKTMMIWRPDAISGIWMNEVTVGELSHSALGFYGGVWSPCGDAILAHGYGGSLHLWKNIDSETGDWQPRLTPSGHSAPVVDVSWAKTGQFLLSASNDQTARLFACWKGNKEEEFHKTPSWHEIGRPQVHGHDLNCLSIIRGAGNHRYVSGADEKVARVFEAPGAFLDTLSFTIGGKLDDGFIREDVHILGANMSALGLSQKPIYTQGRNSSGAVATAVKDYEEAELNTMDSLPDAVPSVLTEPPLEEHLAQNTLWPETHKLYGHGNELFTMCSDHAGKVLATACKAQSGTFAQIWLWQVNSWRPVDQLKSHGLTVTQMEFSHNDRFLLSVSRDRHLSVFECVNSGGNDVNTPPTYKLVTRMEAHKRIIWACSWSHCDCFFATGSRDKIVKIWAVTDTDEGVKVENTITLPIFKSSVTALAWAPELPFKHCYLLAVGMEDGNVELWRGVLQPTTEGTAEVETSIRRMKMNMSCLEVFNSYICHGATVHRLAWRDLICGQGRMSAEGCREVQEENLLHLASCGADHSIRLFVVNLCQLIYQK